MITFQERKREPLAIADSILIQYASNYLLMNTNVCPANCIRVDVNALSFFFFIFLGEITERKYLQFNELL